MNAKRWALLGSAVAFCALAPLLGPLLIGGLAAVTILSTQQTATAGCWAVPTDLAPSPAADSLYTTDPASLTVAGYTGEQLTNAQTIARVGEARGVSVHGQTIAVMTAMGESSLRNIDYGDDRHGVRNPDGTPTSSLGLFQQQRWYGTVEQRLDPVYASTRFYDDLLRVEGWPTLPPTIAAHRAQRNANPYHYERYWPAAVEVVEALADIDLPGLDPGSTTPCLPGDATTVPVTAEGWANPATGARTSGFGPRNTGIPGASTYHLGADVAAACGTPIHAAGPGVVVAAGPVRGWGNHIKIDHGNGVATVYAHLLSGTLRAGLGQQVTGGTQIAAMGGDRKLDPIGAGTSSGCHLHFEVHINGAAIDPHPFMAARGVTLGAP